MKKALLIILAIILVVAITVGGFFGYKALTKNQEVESFNDLVEKTANIVYTKDGEGSLYVGTVFETNYENGENVSYKIPGAKYEIIYEENEKYYVYAEGVADEEGYVAFKGIEDGEYFLRMTEASEGYELHEQYYKFIIDDEHKTYHQKISVSLKETKLVVEVTDENDNPLAGAKFDVYLVEGEKRTYVNYMETGDKGLCGLGNLMYGYYEVVQTEYPEGYQDLNIKKIVELTPENPTIENLKIVMVKAK